ncbi:calmodulin-A-like [Teleopsis dalmanni]|uniref:calmodulin-A-like n=1 Tax=Teleopsis dalmanni TaxID=139649 RepID=UPI0018CE57B9|nr:calmodulin-A-like [Teleopsis dalmanni]
MSRHLTDEQIEELREAFHIIDQDGDGRITPRELENVMRVVGQFPTESEILVMINHFDTTGNGMIDFNDFVAMMSTEMRASDLEAETREAFNILDFDGNGYIAHEELKYVIANLGMDLTDEDIENMILEVDTDGDGQISYEEFSRLFYSAYRE